MRLRAILGPTRFTVLASSLLMIGATDSLILHRAQAQALTGAIAGRVIDASGAAVPNAKITVRNTDVSSSRTSVSGTDGAFRVTGLTSGAYTVEGRASNLASRRPVRLTVTLGSNTEIVLRLDVAAVKQSTTVNARGATVEGNTVAPPANTAEGTVGSFLPGLTVTYLPNRDRDLTQFISQAAVTGDDPDGTGAIIAGQRSNAIAFEVDGTRFTDPLLGGRRGKEDDGLFLPLSAVREFQIVHSGVDASVGDTSAGLISVATKAGSNRARGDAFYTGRPPQFTSGDAFGNSLDSVQNAFGFGYGSPIRRDHSFYFVSVEQDFVHAPYYIAFAPQAPGASIPASLTSQQGQIIEHQSPTAVFGRLDVNVSPLNTLNMEIGYNREQRANAGDGLTRSLNTDGFAANISGQSLTTRIGLGSVLNAQTFNSAVVAWSSDHRNRTPNSSVPEQFINGFGALGGDASGQHLFTTQQTQLSDNLSLTHGHDEFALGGRFAADPAYEQQEENLNGRFDYNSLAAYLNNQPRRFQQTFVTGDTRYRGTVTELALYANTRVQLHSNLFLTAGVRWAAQWNPQPPHPNATLAVTQRIPADLSQWQPRAALAWDSNKKITVRVSSGLFSAPTPATLFHRVFVDGGTQTATIDSYFDPSLLILTGANTATPHALASPPAGLSTLHALVVGVAPEFRNPRSLQSTISIDDRISSKLALTAGYIYVSTWRLERQLDENLAAPIISANGLPQFLLPRPIAGVGRLLVEQSTAHSSYSGGYLSLNAPISRRTTLLANYTLSRTRDDDSSSGPYSPVTALNPFNLRAEGAYSLLDQRQTFNVNAIVNLPVGFKLNPLFVAHSGLSYTPIVGFDTQNDANDWNDRIILNNAVQPRNIYRQPGFSNLDLRVVKDFTLKGEGHHLDLFMDIFNLTGARNLRFDSQGVSLFGNASNPVYSAGMPLFAPGVTRLGGPREIQFTARIVGF
jgi:Carboxypeptidase regulatory-like domain